MTHGFITALCFLVLTIPSALSAKLLILTEDLPPLNFMLNGKLVGPSVEIVQEIQKRIGSSDPIHVYPWARAYKLALEQENVVLFGTTHTEIRDSLFKWVGPLATKRDILVAKKGSGVSITSLEDARKVRRIGTLRGDTRHQLLTDLGFTNLEPVSNDKKNAKKLILGRLDLWAYKKPGMETVCRLAGVDQEDFEEVLHLRTIEVSIAFSKKTADNIVSTWQNAFQQMLDDGTVQQIREKWMKTN